MKSQKAVILGISLATLGVMALAARHLATVRMGKQSDGTFIVSTGQRIPPGTVAFNGRPVALAPHPSGKFLAVLGQNNVFLARASGVIAGTEIPLDGGAAYNGLTWASDGSRLYASVANGTIRELLCAGETLKPGRTLNPKPDGTPGNPRPGGIALTRDGKTLFVAACDRNAVVEMDLASGAYTREYRTQLLPFTVKLSEDEQTLIASNWGGREPEEEDESAETAAALIVVDPRGVPASGTVSILPRKSGTPRYLKVGLHPTDIAVRGSLAYIANAASDTISVVDIAAAKQIKEIPLKWGRQHIFGAMPNALTLSGDGKTLYIATGGDNAVAEMELPSGKVRGYRPAGYYPTSLALSPDGAMLYAVNTKGNGSVRNTLNGEAGNAHDFQGTVSVINLSVDLSAATRVVAENNGWNRDQKDLKPDLAVYKGAIKHVLYIIKENRTYDEVFGDMPEGNGDPKLCGLGGPITPNHHKLAREFTLFDNGYVSGTNSADGHAWSTQSIANDYLEHFYTGYRTYPDDGDCAMSISSGGTLWEAALKKKKSVRIYGEFVDDRLAVFDPQPKDWFEMWKDRPANGGPGRIKTKVGSRVRSMKNLYHPEVVYWPLIQSDQARADLFIAEYQKFSKANTVPNLMILCLPCDHTEGRDPKYPTPQAMVADNDLALGRVVEAVSKSPQWKDTCIFVIEDDAQSGPDHVDGHRTVYAAYSPYVRRKFVDSTLYTTVSMLRSIELMLGLDPMNKFDALSPPLTTCFTNTPNLTPFTATPNRTPLDERNPPLSAQTGKERYWTERSLSLDWSGIDRPDHDTLNRVLWHTLHNVNTPYPAAPHNQ